MNAPEKANQALAERLIVEDIQLAADALRPAIHDLLERIQSEYREMPGLSLTAPQAQRLWALDSTTCGFVLTTLVGRKVLKRTAIGKYVRGPFG